MVSYLKNIFGGPTPQSESLPMREAEMVQNNAGGYVFPVDDWTRLNRFLILGSEGGSYYVGERKLTKENADAVARCLAVDGPRTVREIVAVSQNNRASSNSMALFAMAMAVTFGDLETKHLAREALPKVARTASFLMEWITYVESMRRWGRGLRRTVENWYESMPLKRLVYQTVKYRTRNGWSHRDLMRKVHYLPYGGHKDLVDWIAHGTLPPDTEDFALVHAYEAAKTATVPELVDLIRDKGLTWEMVPKEQMGQKEVWEALSESMAPTALIRNLANLTRYEVVTPLSDGTRRVVERLRDVESLRRARVHPVAILSALMTYKSGVGKQNEWVPVPQVADALDAAFDHAFEFAPQTNQRFYLGVDVSTSMTGRPVAGVRGLTCSMAAAAMAMAIARREPNYYIAGFSAPKDYSYFSRNNKKYRPSEFMVRLDITARDRLTDAMEKTERMTFGPTDCALPMLDALEKRIPVDIFVVLTDNETWLGNMHPAQALREYRQQMGIPAKLVVVGMVSNGFTIADPADAGMMDVAGFDTAVPRLIADFAAPQESGEMVGVAAESDDDGDFGEGDE